MRDELETLEKELKRKAPKPKPAVRKQTLSKAMEAFDRRHQGLSLQPRQTGQEVNVMSWLKNRIHFLQPRFLVAACALCLAVAGGAVIYWLLTWSTEPAETSQVARLEPEPSAAPARASPSSPPKKLPRPRPPVIPPVASPHRRRHKSRPVRSAKEAVPASPTAAEPAPVAATEDVTVEVPSEKAVLGIGSRHDHRCGSQPAGCACRCPACSSPAATASRSPGSPRGSQVAPRAPPWESSPPQDP